MATKKKAGAAPKKAAAEKKAPKAAPAPEAPKAQAAPAAGAAGAQQQAGGTPGTEQQSASFKNFRHHPEMENFYRFVYENDLRFEALAIIDEIMAEKAARKRLKAGGPRKAQAH